jgi:hypothetical protein
MIFGRFNEDGRTAGPRHNSAAPQQ